MLKKLNKIIFNINHISAKEYILFIVIINIGSFQKIK